MHYCINLQIQFRLLFRLWRELPVCVYVCMCVRRVESVKYYVIE